jgi:EmrB/QacA subfamily drug resistance transporter
MPSANHNPHHERRWAILAVIGIAQLMVVLDATIVNIALPSAQEALGFSNDARQWIVTSYALAFGSLLLLGGRLGDLFGRKNVFIVGLAGFAAASALGGFASSFGMLVTSRALQGAFGALLAPAALGLLTTTFTDPGERGKAFGIFGAIAGGGGAIGLLLGGILTEYLSWRWCLYVNLIFAGIAIVGAVRLLSPQVRDTARGVDLPGVLTATAGLFLLVFGFARAETEGWANAVTIGSLIGSVILLGAFYLIERVHKDPLLPLSIVKDRTRGGAYIAMMLSGAGMFAVFLFLTYFMQQNLGMSPVQTGLAFLPMIALLIASATTSTAVLLPRYGSRPLITAGMLFGGAAMVALTTLNADSTYAGIVLPTIMVMGLGMGMIFAPAMGTGTAGVPMQHAGVASATVNTSQQIGGSVGTALLSTLAASAVTSSLASAGANPSQAVLAAAQISGYTTAFAWAAGIFFVGAILCGSIIPSGTVAVEPGAEPAMAH